MLSQVINRSTDQQQHQLYQYQLLQQQQQEIFKKHKVSISTSSSSLTSLSSCSPSTPSHLSTSSAQKNYHPYQPTNDRQPNDSNHQHQPQQRKLFNPCYHIVTELIPHIGTSMNFVLIILFLQLIVPCSLAVDSDEINAYNNNDANNIKYNINNNIDNNLNGNANNNNNNTNNQRNDGNDDNNNASADNVNQMKDFETLFHRITRRSSRPYDVPQIECPSSEDGIDRFACPSTDRMGRYRCIEDHVLCNGFIDCPNGEDEDRMSCMFYKTTKAHLDVLADAMLRMVRGRF